MLLAAGGELRRGDPDGRTTAQALPPTVLNEICAGPDLPTG
ncbi:hypothetical protein ACFXG6_02285 [Streptomyces roseus]